jgi:Zn-dependent metalloprotease
VIVALLIAAASFRADFPKATVAPGPSGKVLISASGFAARGLGGSPEAAARAFLRRYGAEFGVTERQKLVPRGNKAGKVRFERQLDGDPIFDADVVLAVNSSNAVTQITTLEVPAQTTGAFELTKDQGVQAAFGAIADPARNPRPRAARGWKSDGSSLRPVWRVDLIAGLPESDWRSYVDAQSGRLMSRIDLRPAKPAPKRDLAL